MMQGLYRVCYVVSTINMLYILIVAYNRHFAYCKFGFPFFQ